MYKKTKETLLIYYFIGWKITLLTCLGIQAQIWGCWPQFALQKWRGCYLENSQSGDMKRPRPRGFCRKDKHVEAASAKPRPQGVLRHSRKGPGGAPDFATLLHLYLFINHILEILSKVRNWGRSLSFLHRIWHSESFVISLHNKQVELKSSRVQH